jgi:phosphoenolpyruvate synthase/pyruvate phosphate dikinase
MNIPGVDGIITTKIGKSSHASISAKRDGKLFVCEAEITTRHNQWFINHHPIRLGNEKTPDIFTVVGNPKSVSPYSGNIYKGEIPLTPTKKIGVTS